MSEVDPPIRESYWVEPGRFLAGEYPSAAYEARSRERLGVLLESGINTFYDLTLLNELPLYLPILREEASERGIKIQHIRFPVLDHNIPPRGLMTAILDSIDSALARGRNVYIHCWGGIGRTGTVVGCYLVRRGLTGEQALEKLAEWWKYVPKSAYFPHPLKNSHRRHMFWNGGGIFQHTRLPLNRLPDPSLKHERQLWNGRTVFPTRQTGRANSAMKSYAGYLNPSDDRTRPSHP